MPPLIKKSQWSWPLFFVTESSSMSFLGVVVQGLGRRRTRIGIGLRVLGCLTPTFLPMMQQIPPREFRRRFKMNKELFVRIVFGIRE
jgi:hypothetical protein